MKDCELRQLLKIAFKSMGSDIVTYLCNRLELFKGFIPAVKAV